MSLLYLGKLLQIATTSFAVVVLTILLRYSKIRYIKDLQLVFSSYLLLIVLTVIPVINTVPLISSFYKYILLAITCILLFKSFTDKKHRIYYILPLGLFVITPIILTRLGNIHLLEGIGFIYLGLTFIITGVFWLKLVVTHLISSKITAVSFILFGLHLLDFIVFQYDDFIFLIGYIVAASLVVIITFGLLLLNFDYLKELDDANYKKYTSLFNNSSDAILLIDNHIIFECNQKTEKLFKCSKTDIIGQTPMKLSTPIQENGRNAEDYATELFDSSSKGNVTLFDWVHVSSDGEKIYCEIALFPIGLKQFAAVIRDMTSKYAYEEEINFHKYYDTLTHLPKRELFIDRLARSLDERSSHVALIAFNIDDFKQINDQYGHEIGDLLLKQIAKKITSAFANDITLTRLGGDEFVAIIDKLENNDRIYIPIEKIQSIFKNTFEVNGNLLAITACIGIAFPESNKTHPTELLKNVDLALNVAKSKGKEKLEFYTREEKDIFTKRIILENEMKAGIKANEFIPYYQPIVDAQTGTIVGAEVLARWQRKDGTMVYPNVFIPVAEETELIKKIGSVVLSTACRDCKTLFDTHSDFILHINLSPLQLQNTDIIYELKDLMEKWEITARHLVVELTETVFIEDPQRTNDILKEIRNIGIRVALDDFGTGYSSLSYLLEMQVDKIKIDRSFIIRLPHDAQSRAMVDHLTKLIHSLGYSIVVEGVEEEDQAEYIISLGCHYIQGYYYYRPMPFEQLNELLSISASSSNA